MPTTTLGRPSSRRVSEGADELRRMPAAAAAAARALEDMRSSPISCCTMGVSVLRCATAARRDISACVCECARMADARPSVGGSPEPPSVIKLPAADLRLCALSGAPQKRWGAASRGWAKTGCGTVQRLPVRQRRCSRRPTDLQRAAGKPLSNHRTRSFVGAGNFLLHSPCAVSAFSQCRSIRAPPDQLNAR